MSNQSYVVVKYSKSGKFVGVIAGMGRNRGRWDATHSKRTAQKYARQLREECPEFDYRVEEST